MSINISTPTCTRKLTAANSSVCTKNKNTQKKYAPFYSLSKIFIALLFLFGIGDSVLAQSNTYSTPGTYSWVCPTGVTSVTVQAWGGGGAGGGVNNTGTNRAGGGGGGGAYTTSTVTVSSGTTYTIVVGAGGTGVSAADGNAGSSSTFGSTTVVALGGAGGRGHTAASATAMAGGAGGIGASCTPSSLYSGGAGAASVTTPSSGAGGGSAGSGSVGGSASGTTAGTAGTGTNPGGAGAAGLTAGNAVGTNCANIGGGGSGARAASGSLTARVGGSGGPGQVILTYTCTVASNVTSPAASVASSSSVLTWTNPTTCVDEIMIVAAPASNTGTPSGNGSSYTANLAYGSGTGLGNGFVVYKGSTSSQTVTGLTNGTTYYVKFFTRAGSVWSIGTEITVIPALTYCAHTNTNTTYYISSFSTTTGVTNITNNGTGAGTNNYSDYTAKSVSQYAGSPVNFSITETGGTSNYGIWVDWNNDGDFADANENVFITSGYAASASGTFSVPAGTAARNYRMRVVNDYIYTPVSCGTSSTSVYGEAEDYTFTVLPPSIVLSDNGTQVSAASVSPGASNVVLHQSKLTVTGGSASLTGMTCTTAGTYVSADITNLKVWYSTSSTFATGTSTLLSTYTTPGAAGAKTFPSFTTQSVATGTGYIYITADVASGATNGNTINLSALATSNFTFTTGTLSGSTTAGGAQTFTSSSVALSDNDTQVSSANVSNGSTNVVLHQSKLTVTNAAASITGMTCTTNGTYAATDVSNLKVWYSTSSTFSSGSATLLSTITSPGTAGNKTFSTFTSQNISTSAPGYIYITIDVSSTATSNNTINVSALTTSDFTFASGSKTGSTTNGGAQTFVTPSISLADNGTQVSSSLVNGGTSNVILHQSKLTVATAAANLTGLTCITTGTYVSADITNLKAWYSTSSTFNSSTATLLSTFTTPGAAGAKTFPSFTSQTIPVGDRYIYITADISSTATNANTISVSALATTNFTFASGSLSGSTTVGGTKTIFNYCTPSATTTTNYITGFTITNGQTNFANTGTSYGLSSGYSNYSTSVSCSQYPNSSVNFSVSLAGNAVSNTYSYGVSIWIDWNNNGTFETSERMYNSGTSYVYSASGSFTVPAGTASGNYRMRVVADYNSTNPSSCTITYGTSGECEDYTFTVLPQPAISVATYTINAFTTTYGTASAAQTFSVSGTNLAGDITATAPTGYEVSNGGSSYGSTATFTNTSGSSSGTLYVRLSATAAVGTTIYDSKNIVLSSSYATSVNITTPSTGDQVSALAITVTATGPTKTYGTALTTGTSSTNFTVTGTLPSGQSITSVTLTPDAAGLSATTAAGSSYTVTPSLATGTGGFSASNYSITYVTYNGTVAVSSNTITVTATGPSKTYGTALTAGTSSTNFTVNGTLVSGQSITSVTLTPDAAGLSATTAAGSTYTVTPSLATGTGGFSASNYNINYVTYNGTVSQKSLIITATNTSKTEGDVLTNPTTTATNFVATGLVNSETVGSVTITYGTSAGAGASPGVYTGDATPSGATGGSFTASNYSISYVAGDVTVLSATAPACPISNSVSPNTSQTICLNGTASELTSSVSQAGNVGTPTLLYQWYYNISNSNIISTAIAVTTNGTSSTFTPPSSSASHLYYFCVAYATDNSCGQTATTQSLASNVVDVTVISAISNNTITADQSICTGNTPNALVGSSPSGATGSYTYQWQSSTTSSSAGFSDISGATSISYSPSSLTQTTWYRRKVSSGACVDAISSPVAITVNPVISGNTSGADVTICSGSTTSLTVGAVSGGDGASYTYLWESSSNNSTWSAAAGTNNSANYTTAALSANTYFRRTVTSGGCSNTATSILVTVDALITGNTSGAATAICAGSTATLTGGTVGGGDGVNYTYSWESSTDNATWSAAAGTNNTANYTTAILSANTYFRRTVTSGACTNTATSVLVTVNPVLNGTYTVGAGGNYTSLTAAVAAYNSACLTGPVVFSLTGTDYSAAATNETFPITINANSYASSTNTLTIKPATGVTSTITGSSTSSIIQLNGADYIIIDGSNSGTSSRNLTISNSNTGTTSAVVWISSASSSNGSTNNTIKNSTITGNAALTTLAGVVSSSSTSTLTYAGYSNSNNTISNNAISNAQEGILILGYSTSLDDNWQISNNTITTLGFDGIVLTNMSNYTVTGNSVSTISTSSTSQLSGINLGQAHSSGSITKNSVSSIVNTNNRGAAGIFLGSSTILSNVTVANNFISGVAASGNATTSVYNGHGIVIYSGGGYSIYNNTVNMNVNQTKAAYSAALYVYTGLTTSNSGGIKIVNNIFANTQTLYTSTSYSIYCRTDNSIFSQINYNDYYSSGTSTLGYVNGLTYTAVSDIGTALGTTTGNINVLPVFVDPVTNLHLNVASNCLLDGSGTPLSSVTTDYDGDPRSNTAPDMGADEFTGSPLIASAGSMTVCQSSNNQTTTLSYTASSNTANSYSINWDAAANANGLADQAATAFTSSTSGGTIATVAVNALAPATSVPAGSYAGTLTATNASNCSTSIPVTLTVLTPLSNLVYTSSSVTYCTGIAITANTVSSITGGGTITYSVSPSLPTGLSLNTTTGSISGTPTLAATAANYVVTASNGYCSTSASVNITILTAMSGLTYTSSSASYCTGSAITSNTVTSVTGGGTITYTVNPSLPSGLSINSGTGAISGTPDAATAAADYVITASNGTCTISATINITVNATADAPALDYPICPGATSITGTSTEANGATVTVYKAGVSIGTTTVASGVWELSGIGSTVITAGSVITAKVQTADRCLSVASSSVTVSQTSATPVINYPICSGSQTISGTSTEANGSFVSIYKGGVYLGTTTVSAHAWTYTNFTPVLSTGDIITATVAAFDKCVSNTSSSVTVITSVSGLTYASSSVTYCTGSSITANTVSSVTGGGTITYSVSPSLPSGLSISSTTGSITGTPNTGSTAADYVVTASNGCSSTTSTINITVLTAMSGLSYASSTPSYCVGSVITENTASVTGDGTITYSVDPSLPVGLSFNTSTGSISGTPTAASTASDYVITASNGTCSTTATLNITVLTAMSGLSYTSSSVTYCTGSSITANTVSSVTGGGTITYSVSPSLPAGLILNTSTGAISGTPTTSKTSTDYTITASNGCSSTDATVNITVLTAMSGLSYASNTVSYCVGSIITSNTVASITGGGTITYSVNSSLPAGLILNTSTGAISGTPSSVTAAADYVVTATNGVCSTTKTLNITINVLPTADISGDNASLCAGSSTDLTFTLTGTGPWSITYTDGTSNFTTTSSSGTKVVSVTPSAASTVYTLVAVSDANCDATSLTGSATIALNYACGSIKAPSVTGPYCQGSVLTLNFDATGNFTSNNFTVQLSDASGSFANPVTISSPYSSNFNGTSSLTISNVTIPLNTPAGTGYKIRIVSTNPNLIGSESTVFTVAAQPTTATNNSATTICSTGSTTLAGNSPSVGTGLWSVSGPSTSSSQFYDATVYNTTFTPAPGAGAGNYVVTWTISNSVCTASSDNATITVNAPPTVNAGADFATCSNTGAVSITTGVSVGNSNSYQWTTSNGTGAISNGTSITAATYTPSAADLAAAGSFSTVTLTLTVQPKTGCSGTASDSKVLTIYSPATPAITNTTPLSFCHGGSVSLEATGSNASANYVWSIDQNGRVTTSTDYPLVVSHSAGVTVSFTNDEHGCASTAASAITVVREYAAPTVYITGNAEYCSGTNNTLTAVATPGSGTISSSSYQWYKDGVAISGATSSTYTVTGTGVYKVVVTNSHGCEAVACP